MSKPINNQKSDKSEKTKVLETQETVELEFMRWLRVYLNSMQTQVLRAVQETKSGDRLLIVAHVNCRDHLV